ncbi:MAG: bifunctional methylenetetrahydrofolate dehydrogenase/methenyltetrahydrofolate cyclohydrolase FolD [Candidatus Sericytochromatia bacterium]|nr:bifunctional methylenetetrahydrofolate dehydrogenase/methenyltetrahydrofolate cyclohydrolase FolD [Candidatus Sericytochromatia bacterium]
MTDSAPTLMRGQEVAAALEAELRKGFDTLGFAPGLAVVRVGDDPASEIYVNHKIRACERLGFYSEAHHLPASSTQSEVQQKLEALNADSRIHGILLQLPLPQHLDEKPLLSVIDPAKDVDGFHPINGGRLLAGQPHLLPCTPAGIMEILRYYDVQLEGLRAVVIGRSNIVGKPMALLLLQANASVSVLHSRTPDLSAYTREADLIVVAVGKQKVLTAEMVKPGVVVVDVGMNRLEGRKVTGDVDFDSVAPRCRLITPVPGGVGPMTIAMLLKNTLLAAQSYT